MAGRFTRLSDVIAQGQTGREAVVGFTSPNPPHIALIIPIAFLIGVLGGYRLLTPTLPLDDAYIHLQYARAIAEGHPFSYIAGQPATSGGTSLIYPVLIAPLLNTSMRPEVGMILVGLGFWIASAFLILSLIGGEAGMLFTFLFVLQGSLYFAFLSGMETGLFIFVTLLTLRGVVRRNPIGAISAGALAALVRPEGAVIGVGAALYMMCHTASRRYLISRLPLYALPVLAALVQPLINLIYTSSITASGMQAKSYLYNVPRDWGVIIRDMGDMAVRIWRELFSVTAPDYGTLILCVLALIMVGVGAAESVRTRKPTPALLIGVWFVGLTLLISTLETAFWQFKRYQQPMIALCFPLVGWLMLRLWETRRTWLRVGAVVGILGLLIQVGLTLMPFMSYYDDNTAEVASSQLPMAHYVREEVPPNAIIGVHDIGVMAFVGGHNTYDLVGLTTPDAALPWRNGPGAVYEQMARSPYRPDYLAIYPDARGLTYFQNTALFAQKLRSFPSTKPRFNVASATDSGQDVYQIDWRAVEQNGSLYALQPFQHYVRDAVEGMSLVDSVNVAYLHDEEAHQYQWWQVDSRPGFPTELYDQTYPAESCEPAPTPTCRVIDGGRLISGGESMVISTRPGQDLIWVIRVHPRYPIEIKLYVDEALVGTRTIPALPGRWIEIPSLVEGHLITGAQTRIRVEANLSDPTSGHYMPYQHWFYQGRYTPATAESSEPRARFGAHLWVYAAQVEYEPTIRALSLKMTWDLKAPEVTDGVLFLHLYDQDGTLREDAQLDRRPGGGTLPLANWLPGLWSEQYTLTIPDNVPPGRYRVAIGMYDPRSMVRLGVQGTGADADQRLFLGEIDLK